MIDITVNKKGTVKQVSFKVFDYLLGKGKLSALTIYAIGTDKIVKTEWFINTVINN
jgi:hypothetical protein